jgi:hypothetical protein
MNLLYYHLGEPGEPLWQASRRVYPGGFVLSRPHLPGGDKPRRSPEFF